MPVELESDLRTTSDTLLTTIDRLRDLEMEKRAVAPGSKRFLELADEIRRLAGGVLDFSADQERLARKSNAIADAGRPDLVETPIDDMDPVRDVQHVLSDWRDAERRLAAAEPGSSAAETIRAEVDRLRAEYRHSLDAAVKRTRDR